MLVATWAHILVIAGLSHMQANIFMSSDSFLLFRAMSRALMVLNYSHCANPLVRRNRDGNFSSSGEATRGENIYSLCLGTRFPGRERE